MKLDIFLAALQARYRLVLLITLATVLGATVVTLMLPKTYVATASLLIDARDEQTLGGRATPSERERLGYIQTQADILTGTQVARQVAQDLGMGSKPKTQERFLKETNGVGNIDDWLGQRLAKLVKVDTSQSSVIRLSFAAEEPEFAAQVANAFAQAYIATTLKLRTEPARQASLWFDDQVVGLRRNLELAQRRLAEFQQEKGIVATDERYELESARMVDLANQTARAQGRREDPVGGSLARAETRLRELSVEFGERHPQYQQQKSLVESLREKMLATPRQRGPSAAPGANALVAALEAQREHLLKLKVARGELAVLAYDVEIAQRTYDAAMQRLMAMRLESHASQTSVSLLDAATVPSKPTRPRVAMNIGLSLAGGLGLGLCLVYLLELRDQRVRLTGDLASDLGVPLLGVLNRWDSSAPALSASASPYRLS